MSRDKKDWEALSGKERLLREAADILSVPGEDLPRVVDRFLREIREMKKPKT